MPVPPIPRHYRCPSCGWSTTTSPRSDVLIPGHDYFSACPRCRHAPLDSSAVTGIPADVAQMVSRLANWLRR